MNKYKLVKIIFTFSAFSAVCLGIALLVSTQWRDFIISSAENIIVHHTLNRKLWHNTLVLYAISLFILSVVLFGVCFGRTLERISGILKKMFLEIRKIHIPQIARLFALLCLFLFLYVRLNINTMPVIFCWAVYRLGFWNWLSKKFGKKEAQTALIIFGAAALFFVTVMIFLRCTVVMDIFHGADRNRVLGDFTQVSVGHYRIKVHPFYVIIWQSLYHLFRPLETTTSLVVRILIAVFAGLNIGIFSLFVSRLAKNRFLNILLCTVMAVSFPQIFHGSQIVESFIFTQTSLLMMLVYFSFALPEKKYNLPVLLALALFVTGNNIAYICIFGIFYLVLLYRTHTSFRAAFHKIYVFSLWFIAIFSALLLVQTLFYGISAPSDIFLVFIQIIKEEGAYITLHPISWKQYAANFFGIVLFEYLPLNMGALFKYGWVWAATLAVPFVCIKKITHKPLFFAVAASCVFLFVFHRFYGINGLGIYAPVIMCLFVSLFAFIGEALPCKISILICAALLAVMLPVNAAGTYTMHRINRFIFGTIDSGDFLEYEANIEKLKKRISNYTGYRLFIFKALQETEAWPRSPLHDEILRASQHNDIDIALLPFAEANRQPKLFYFGLENRRKLVFQNDTLKDFKTGEILFSFPNAESVICPWNYSVKINCEQGCKRA